MSTKLNNYVLFLVSNPEILRSNPSKKEKIQVKYKFQQRKLKCSWKNQIKQCSIP